MREKGKPEILAPAGSMGSLKAAISAGCDAVYIGGSRFGARAYADNPQGQELIDAIRYCHLYGTKIYLTVNTLLKEGELRRELYDYILPCYREGLDAVIVQDVGVMRYLHRHFPELPLHASTQMTLTMGKGAGPLEQYGVNRIVPARELTLPELVQMRRDTGLEIEVFVHGALCYCYSGQCLFSSMLGGRSGNRGRCAQPCRMPYRVREGVRGDAPWKQEEGSYLLSMKENCSLAHVGRLIEAGVDSFKIEGRMKRPEYTAFTTAIYRKYVDLYFELGREGYEEYLCANRSQWREDLRKLAELYNRSGFTSGYLEGRAGVPGGGMREVRKENRGAENMLSALRPNHGGTMVGKVLAVDRHTVTYRLEQDLHRQDVVEFRDSGQKQIYEYTIGEGKRAGQTVTARYQKGCRILPGDAVYRTKDADLLEEIRENYIRREKKVALQAVFHGRERKNMVLELTCRQKGGETVRVQAEGDECQKARQQPATVENIRKLLCQTGDTPFVLERCRVLLEGELFLPVGAVKQLRRQALAQMKKKLEQMGSRNGLAHGSVPAHVEDFGKPEEVDRRQNEEITCLVSVLTWEQFREAVSSRKVDAICLKMDKMPDGKLMDAVREGSLAGKEMYLVLPAIFRSAVYEAEKKKLSDRDNLYQMEQVAGFVVRNMESFVFLRDEVGVDPSRIITDSNLYITNREAEDYWREQGCRQMTLPLELTGKELEVFSGAEGMQAVVYGHLPLMVSAQCIRNNTQGCAKGGRIPGDSARDKEEPGMFLTLQDARGREFYVFNACKYCYNVIYQGQPLVHGQAFGIRQPSEHGGRGSGGKGSHGERQEALLRLGVRRFRYDFTVETPEEMRQILQGKLPSGHTGHFYDGVE